LKHFDTPPKSGSAGSSAVAQAVSDAAGAAHHNAWRLNQTGVNLGNLYTPARAIGESPVFTQRPLSKPLVSETVDPLHIALVKLREPQALDDQTLEGIAVTLSQLTRLGLNIALVVDCDESDSRQTRNDTSTWETMVRDQSARIVEILEEFNAPGAFVVDQSLCYTDSDSAEAGSEKVKNGVEVRNKELLFSPLADGIIPVVPPIAYTSEFKKKRVDGDDVILALTREFAGLTAYQIQEDLSEEMRKSLCDAAQSITDRPLLDRIIILDPVGGIPSKKRADGTHVFINLEAEYRDVKEELRRWSSTQPPADAQKNQTVLGSSNPVSKFLETEVSSLDRPLRNKLASEPISTRHEKNLDVVRQALMLLPPSSSALIITPVEAAISSQSQFLPTPSTGVRTRRSKNPLIHNLLTDKPMISSSLPSNPVHRATSSKEPGISTFLKKGIPVTIIPYPSIHGWTPISPTNPSIELETDHRIDFPRLVDLIEDSFRRKLDVKAYLDRIRGRVAGIIIAGNYEGGAICTWETPPNAPNSDIRVPYLDKFAVLTSSQGSGGVADIVWGALTRTCFPSGLVWRSRSNNPVNKWYFERAVGMWNLPGDAWTMFWTTSGVAEEWGEKQRLLKEGKVDNGKLTRWEAYVDVCSGIVPSWADGKRPD